MINGWLIAIETPYSVVVNTHEFLRVTYQVVKAEDIFRRSDLSFAAGMASAGSAQLCSNWSMTGS